jgi:hypothetical protein
MMAVVAAKRAETFKERVYFQRGFSCHIEALLVYSPSNDGDFDPATPPRKLQNQLDQMTYGRNNSDMNADIIRRATFALVTQVEVA